VGLRAGLDTEAREKSFRLCWESNLECPVVQPVARHYTDSATQQTYNVKTKYNNSDWPLCNEFAYLCKSLICVYCLFNNALSSSHYVASM
jgi:hypothetical protein